MSTFILRAGKEPLRRSPRKNKGVPGPQFTKEFQQYNPFSDKSPDPGQQKDLEEFRQSLSEEESLSEGSSDSSYRTEETPESESIPPCPKCGDYCVCSDDDSEFSSSMDGPCSGCEEDECVCSTEDEDASLLSEGACSGCGEDEAECQCSDDY